MTYTVTDATQDGWTIQVAGTTADAKRTDGTRIQVASSIPLFTALANIAERQGKGFLLGYGGTQAVTPALVTATSGETYIEPAQTPDIVAATQTDANAATIRQRAAAALSANDTYLAIASPTTAQAVAQVRTLTKECNGLIRLLLNALSDVSDT